VHLVGFVTIRT